MVKRALATVIATVGSYAAAAAAAAAVTACGSFEDPTIVVDLRVLAMSATPPTQVIDIDLANPPSPLELLQQLAPTEVCALIADPPARRLVWSYSLCGGPGGTRCDDDAQRLASGVAEDPETATPAPRICTTVSPDGDLLRLLLDLLEDDEVNGLGGLSYAVQLRIGGEGDDPALDQYASKAVQVLPRIPPAATANTNPSVARFEISIDEAPAVPLPLGRCVDNPAPIAVTPDVRLRITPIEPDGVREVYVVPTLDGRIEQFTESLTYQWIASAGGFSDGTTGGPRNVVTGNPAPLFTDFRPPDDLEVGKPAEVTLWIIQRDERFGVQWYEACLRVQP